MTFLKRLFGARADEAQVEEHQTSFEPCSPPARQHHWRHSRLL
ncbi:MAG: hypothetical protein QNL02_08910 [Paracoccaceae bacterium]